MTSSESEEVFKLFTRDHPNFKNQCRWVGLPDGSREFVCSTEAMEAFTRWCLVNGLGDREKVIRFLTEGIPALKEAVKMKWGSGQGSALGNGEPHDRT